MGLSGYGAVACAYTVKGQHASTRRDGRVRVRGTPSTVAWLFCLWAIGQPARCDAFECGNILWIIANALIEKTTSGLLLLRMKFEQPLSQLFREIFQALFLLVFFSGIIHAFAMSNSKLALFEDIPTLAGGMYLLHAAFVITRKIDAVTANHLVKIGAWLLNMFCTEFRPELPGYF